MAHKHLIYECKLNDLQLLTLTEVRNNLADALPELKILKSTSGTSILIMVSQALLDIREVINNYHRNQYKWTSYALAMAEIKLSMAVDNLKSVINPNMYGIRKATESALITVTKLIQETNSDYLNADDFDTFG